MEPYHLEPCPFCGHELPSLRKDGDDSFTFGSYVECDSCKVRTPSCDSESVKNLWDTQTNKKGVISLPDITPKTKRKRT